MPDESAFHRGVVRPRTASHFHEGRFGVATLPDRRARRDRRLAVAETGRNRSNLDASSHRSSHTPCPHPSARIRLSGRGRLPRSAGGPVFFIQEVSWFRVSSAPPPSHSRAPRSSPSPSRPSARSRRRLRKPRRRALPPVPARSRRRTPIRSPAPTGPSASQPTLIRNATILTAAGPTHRERLDPAARREDRGGGQQRRRAGGCRRSSTARQVRDAGHHRHALAPRRVRGAGRRGRAATATRRRNPTTPQVWAEHSVWPQDPQFPRDLAGGVTTLQVLPGSANLIGGRSVVLKVVPGAHRAGDEVPRRASTA